VGREKAGSECGQDENDGVQTRERGRMRRGSGSGKKAR
jgi:hypothetical protein